MRTPGSVDPSSSPEDPAPTGTDDAATSAPPSSPLPSRYETVEDARQRGRAHRREAPRSALAVLAPPDRDPVEFLGAQNAVRLPELVPLRFARMLTDPFSFYRGSAGLMAQDLAASPHTGLRVVACGDAHLSNFGVYASPERSLVFDLNDFDEVATAPWEWDLKRLVTSMVIGAQHAGRGRSRVRRTAEATASQYVEGLGSVLELDAIQRHYLHVQPELVLPRLPGGLSDAIEETVRRARRRTSRRAARRLTEVDEGGAVRFREDPPVLMHVDDDVRRVVVASVRSYLSTVGPDIALLLAHFRMLDVVRRVVGVGSVGTRCYLVLLEGPAGEQLVLQVKEALESVLVGPGHCPLPRPFSVAMAEHGQGGRVVGGQRMLQAVSDPFLGWATTGGHDYYVRQFHDMKGAVDIDSLDAQSFEVYGRACALLLARAHAQSPDAQAVAGYVGGGRRVVEAVVDFSMAYAARAVEDFEQVARAAREGRIEVSPHPAR